MESNQLWVIEDEIDRIPRVCKFLFPIASINIIAESNRSGIRCALPTMDQFIESCRGRDRMVVGFITTCATSAYHH